MDKWIKIGIAGSVIWFFVTFLMSGQGLRLICMFGLPRCSNYFYIYDTKGVSIILTGSVVVWVISYLFYRDKK